MPKFLVHATYTVEGVNGLLKEGGTARQKMTEAMVAKLGGKVECFYYCFGNSDLVCISDLPDSATAASLSMTIKASGASVLKVIPLLTASEIDHAVNISIEYRAPGK